MPSLLVLLLGMYAVADSAAQSIPLVYRVEDTGAKYSKPALPAIGELPTVHPLPDPFQWSDGSGRDTSFASWSRRRAEIKAEIEHYEIGPKPVRPKDIAASYSDGTLTVNVTVDGNSLTLTSPVNLPSGEGPFPAVIGMAGGTGSLPSSIFTSRKIATIGFNFQQVMVHTQTRGREPINRLYPELACMGAYSAWSWGVSRIIDGLELVSEDLRIDREHLAATGCSFAGKMALFAGAFDERIALTIAQEPGGGGAAAWRVPETSGKVETLAATSRAWFREDTGQNVLIEPESETIGGNWTTISDPDASGGAFITVKPDLESVAAPPTNDDDFVVITFTTDEDGTYYLFGRLRCPTADDDSFWLKMDDGRFAMANGLGTTGWEWVRISRYELTAGKHKLTIAYRENGANLDRICISDSPYAPTVK